MSIRAEYRRKLFMKHRSKKPLGRGNSQYFNEKRPVNLRAASRELAARRCLRSRGNGHLDASSRNQTATRTVGVAFYQLAKPVKPRRLPRSAQGRRCAKSHPRHGRRKTSARRCRSGTLRQNHKARPWARWPHRTTRGSVHRSDSIVAT